MHYFEEILDETGWGLYHQFVLFVSILSTMCSAIAVTTNVFTLPVAACEIGLSQTELIWINAVLPLGMCIGALILGTLADVITRKYVISLSLVLIFLSVFASGFCSEAGMFIVLNLILGAGAIANIIIVKVNLGEILPMEIRGYYLVLLDMFWTFGYSLASCIYWLMRVNLPEDANYYYTSWRMVYGFPIIACILCLCFHGLIQHSPRILLATSRKIEAFLVLKYIFSINQSEHSDNFKISANDLENLIYDLEIDREFAYNSFREQCVMTKNKIKKIMKQLYIFKHIFLVFMVTLMKTCLFNGYAVSNIWIAKTIHLDNASDSRCRLTILQLLHLSDPSRRCDYFIPVNVFRDYFFTGSSGFAALFVYSYFVDKIGRKLPLTISLICCGAISVNIIFSKDNSYRFLLAVVYMMGVAISNAALDITVIENVPTCTRCTAIGITCFVPFLVSFGFRLVFSSECLTYYCIIGIMTIAVGIVGYFLPDHQRQPMVE